MKTQFKVINRETRKEHILNSEQFQSFFDCWYDEQTKKVKYMNKMNDYAISTVKDKVDEFITNFSIAALGVILVILITKLIMLCL